MTFFDPNRQPKGIPAGGQFASTINTESVHGLRSGSLVTRQEAGTDGADRLGHRTRALLSAGYVPPSFLVTAADPRSSDDIEQWWDEHFVMAEHDRGVPGAGGAGYPKMPDDFTPRRTSGQALSGHRRTHRMSYQGAGVVVRMPSATSVKTYAAETGGTFDIPVQARDDSGKTITAWMRVTNHAPGSWTASGLGFGGKTDAQVSEAVTAILESRRPAHGLRKAGDLLERHRERLARRGTQLERVTSTWISAVGYNQQAGVMVMRTSTGATYGHEVNPDTFAAVRGSASPGRIFNQLVKGNPRQEIATCPDCRAIYATIRGHSCLGHRPAGPLRESQYAESVRSRARTVVGP